MTLVEVVEAKEEILINYINENLTPTVENKVTNGEVFTPLSIVNEMLDKLPKKVWGNPKLKWLDPSVGIGNFMIIIYLFMSLFINKARILIIYTTYINISGA